MVDVDASLRPPPTANGSARAAQIVTGGLWAIAVGGWSFIIPHLRPVHPNTWPWWVLVLGFIAGKALRVELPTAHSDTISLVMSDAAFVTALLLGEPWVVPLGLSIAATITALAFRPPLIKYLFNTAQELVGALLGVLVFEAVSDGRLISARTGFATLLAGLTLGLVGHYLVMLITRVASGQRHQASLRSVGLATVGGFANGMVALQAVYLGVVSLWLAIIPVLIVPLLYLIYRSIRHQQTVTDRADLLYRATSALHEQPNIDEGLIVVLDEVCSALRAKWARIVLLTPDGAVTCAVDGVDKSSSPMTATTAVQESAARRLSEELAGVTVFTSGTPESTRGPISVFSRTTVIAAPIMRGTERAGVVIVDGRDGSADRPTVADTEIVAMMSKQIGVALERGFLERSLHQLVELERQLTRQAFFDGVTGLANRNFLMNDLDQLLSEDDAPHRAVLLVDLDDFKMVNDSLGHVAGDHLLEIVAQRIVGCVGGRGRVSRLGGDEFAVVLRHSPDDEIEHLAGEIIAAVSQLVVLGGREVGVGASIGVRRTEGAPDMPTDLLRDADLALYNSKGMGKGRFTWFAPSMHTQAQERLELAVALANAIDRDEFGLAFQPIVDLASGRVVGAEALLRWQHPERGELSPGVFLRMTEESGLIVELGRMVLHRAFDQLTRWVPQLDDGFYISVNVSARQLQEQNFADVVLAVLHETGAPPDRIVLEITESLFIDDPEGAQRILDRLAAAGLRFGLDDFGTGYSSLSQLHHLPLYLVKIDQSFVARLETDQDSNVVVGAILQLAGAFNLRVVAEGIETEGQRAALVRLGCRSGQGWLFGKPVPAAQFETLMRAGDLSATR